MNTFTHGRAQTLETKSPDDTIVVEGVTCSYGKFVAVDAVSFSVEPGQIHALLGTNGAGKTTLLESIQGLFVVHLEVQ